MHYLPPDAQEMLVERDIFRVPVRAKHRRLHGHAADHEQDRQDVRRLQAEGVPAVGVHDQAAQVGLHSEGHWDVDGITRG